MDCPSRRRSAWGDIDEAPQIKRIREDKDQEIGKPQVPDQRAVGVDQQPPPQPTQQEAPTPTEQPKFYISAPIQGFTVNNDGGCRYLFF